ncbi:acyl-CoA synthetase, putative [Plasmodium malariae]|uniref:Acyl-CoA synthetase, putative n=1 Tax=Plasmodium malariae TaxID=5858 RepID=A0A1D3SMV0_PLAMA|nr:acyl-CoA synthetase, putative [Plasmodium malariae]SCO93188.1 acyl-CoA synthetase, putative [Plasmodium malariae]
MAEKYTLENFLELKNVNDRYIVDLNTEKKQFSYKELYEEIENFLIFFKSINIIPGDEISIILFNSIEYVLSFLSINFNKNICLPQNTNLKKEEYIKYLVNNCKYIIIHDYNENDENYASIKNKHSYYKNVCAYIEDLAEEYQIGLIKIKKNKTKPYFTYSYTANGIDKNDSKMVASKEPLKGVGNPKNDICLHLHTSGTTSKVKIVQLTNNNIKTTIRNIINSYYINKEDNTVIVMPLYHVHGLIGVLLPILFSKGNVLFQVGHTFSASEFWENVVHYNITYFSAVPTILNILLIRYEKDYIIKGKKNDEKVQHKLKFIRTSSSYLDEKLEKEIEEKFATTVLQAYGMTEACHQVSSNKFIMNNSENVISGVNKKYKSVGIPNVGVIIYNEEKKKICDYNELGEICISGKNIMYGYKEANDNDHIFVYVNTIEQKTNYMMKNKFLEISERVPFFKTGDIGYIDEDNFLFISGRIKDIINRGGEKIIPNEIDDVLKGNKLVRDCLTFACKDDIYGEVINSAVILDERGLMIDGNGEVYAIQAGQNSQTNQTSQACKSNLSMTLTTSSLSPHVSSEKKDPIKEEGEVDALKEYDINMSINLNLYYYKYREELMSYVKNRLANFKVPKNVYFVNNFLKTDTGKLSRRKVSESTENLKKMEINVFDVIALIFRKYEIDYIYGLYGIPINKIIYSFIKNGIYYISFRNEINASISCNYVNYFDMDQNKKKKKKKKIGILLTCSGPAFINTLSGLYNAKINHFPMVLICFENYIDEKISLFEKYNNFQYFAQYNFLKKAKEICFESYHVDSLESFSEQFHNCVCTAIKNKYPVYLNIDYKLIGEKITIDNAIKTLEVSDRNVEAYFGYTMNRIVPNEEQLLFAKLVDSFCNIYKSNKKGVIFLGINCNEGIKYILKIAQLLKLPIYTTAMAKSFIKENYVYNVNACKSYLFENIDFCFAIGSLFNFYFNFGNFKNCKRQNMICIDLKNDQYEQGNPSICDHYFFFDLYYVLKNLYLKIKKSPITIDENVDIDARKKWIADLGDIKKRTIDKLCMDVKNVYFGKYENCGNNKFTMEQALLIIRNILIDYFFSKNGIDEMFKKKYFINYLKYVDSKLIADFVNTAHDNKSVCSDSIRGALNMLSPLATDDEVPEEDCDLSDSSCDEYLSDEQVWKSSTERNSTNNGGNNCGSNNRSKCTAYSKFLTKDIKERIIITNEGSITLILGILYLPKFGPFNYVIPQINGMMGIAMNASISAALNNSGNIVFSILGDSSFGFTSNEIETMCRLKLKIVLIIFNNNGIYGDRDYQEKGVKKVKGNEKDDEKGVVKDASREKGKIVDTNFYLKNPSSLYFFSKYENYIISHGGYGCYIDNKEEFIKKMKYVTDENFKNFPALLNVIIQDNGSVNFHFDKLIQ